MNVSKHALERFFQRVPGTAKMKHGFASAEILKHINKHKLIARDADGHEWYRGDIKPPGSENKHPFAICFNPKDDSVVTIYGEGMAILKGLVVGSSKYYIPYQCIDSYREEMSLSLAIDTLTSLLAEVKEQNKALKKKLKAQKGRIYAIDIWDSEDISRFIGKSQRTVRRMFESGKIKGVRKSGIWLAHRDEVLALVGGEDE